jgi:hypothetical protein
LSRFSRLPVFRWLGDDHPGALFLALSRKPMPSPRGIVSCPDMRRLVDLHLLFGKKGAARQAKSLAGK